MSTIWNNRFASQNCQFLADLSWPSGYVCSESGNNIIVINHNLMISISICFSNQMWFRTPAMSKMELKSCCRVLHLIFCRVLGSASGKIILQYELFCQKPSLTKVYSFDKISSSKWFNVLSFFIIWKQVFIEAEYFWKDWLSQF